MIQKTFTILFFFALYSVHAQLYVNGKARYIMNVNGKVRLTGSSCGNNITGGLQYFVGLFEKNTPAHVFAQSTSVPYPGIGHGLVGNFGGQAVFKEDNKINSIKIYTTSRTKGNFNRCKPTDHQLATLPVNNYCFSNHYILENIPNVAQPGYFDLEIYPEVKLSFQDTLLNTLGDDDYLIIPSIEGINKNFYVWEYDAGDGWTALPASFQHKNELSVKGSTFLTKSKINQNIQLRVNTGCGHFSVIHFTYQKSLPHITDKILGKTSCYDSKDGKITLLFDRALEPDEKLSFSIKKDGQAFPLPAKYRNITQLERNHSYTIENLPEGAYQLRMIGSYKGGSSYSAYSSSDYTFSISRIAPVSFSFQKTDVYCHGGNDGKIQLTAFGGTEKGFEYELNHSGQWVAFPTNATTTTIEHLTAGTYVVNVRDSLQCIAKEQRMVGSELVLGAIKNTAITLTEPAYPLSIRYTEQHNPTFYGASNGKIVAQVKGGTLLADNTYRFQVLKDGNQTITHLATTEFNRGAFFITLDNLSKGSYHFWVYDKHYQAATNQTACTVQNSYVTLTQPAPMQATIELKTPISCNSQNEFGNEEDKTPYDGQRDESQNGILKIKASGGVPFTGTQNGGKPYIYTWKKQDKNGNWVTLDNDTDTAKNLSEGKYAINIQDANGIVLGEYNTHTVTKVVDVIYELKEPAKLTLTLQKTDATCRGNDGKITAIPAGGTPPYTYLWSNGATTASIEDLLPMPYTVEIKDEAGCIVQGSTVVMQPNSLTVTGTITPLRCHNASNAAIALAVQGGTAPYQYLWNTGATTSNISNLPSGEYKVKITDAQGCAYFKTFIIENPPKFEIDLGENRTLCNGQTLTLNIAINDPQATYLWTGDNGFSSNTPQVTLSEKGTYRATVTTKDGCIATDAITIESANTQIASEFLLTTQAYENEEVILVNTSSPKGETTQWLMPEDDNIEITNKSDDYISLIFKAKGEYRIGIKQTQGNCFELFYKNIIVEPATDLPKTEKTNEAYVREFEVAPNPNNGKFKAKVVLEKAGAIKFRLYSITGQLVNEKNSASATEHWVDFQDPLPAATYILVLETPYQRLSKKIIIIP